MVLTGDEIDIDESDLHHWKHPLPITLTEDGMVIDESETHSAKHSSPITMTEEGITTDERDVQPRKHSLLISVTDDGIIYECCVMPGRHTTSLVFSLLNITPFSTVKCSLLVSITI